MMNLHAIHIQFIKFSFFVVSLIKMIIFVKDFGRHVVPIAKNSIFFRINTAGKVVLSVLCICM